jgi:hypothetical protein
MPDFGAAVGALIDEVDLGHAPMRFDVPDVHGKQPYAAGADDGSCLDFVMLGVGWHSALLRKHVNLNPEALLSAYDGPHHQLFGTYQEHPMIVRECCIPVTFQAARASLLLASDGLDGSTAPAL